VLIKVVRPTVSVMSVYLDHIVLIFKIITRKLAYVFATGGEELKLRLTVASPEFGMRGADLRENNLWVTVTPQNQPKDAKISMRV